MGRYILSATHPIVFVHVMKTAGISVREAFTRCFARDKAVGIYDSAGFPAKVSAELRAGIAAEAVFYSGHFCASDIQSIFSASAASPYLFSVSRDPEQRIFSLYQYIKSRENDKLYVKANTYNFEDFCHYLYDEHRGLISDSFYAQTVLSSRTGKPLSHDDYLSKYWFVGTVRHFDALVHQAKEDFGLSIHIANENATKSKEPFASSPRLRSFLEQINERDYAIHESLEKTGPLSMGAKLHILG